MTVCHEPERLISEILEHKDRLTVMELAFVQACQDKQQLTSNEKEVLEHLWGRARK